MEIQELLKGLPAWERALEEDGRIDDTNRVTIQEAFSTPDAEILFPKVLANVLKEAAEPEHLVSPLLQVVRIQKGRTLEFPAVNSIQAGEVPEGQEYPEQALAFAKQREGKVSKKGVKVSFTQEVIDDSMWDIVGLHVRAAGRAMGRLKEQIALSRFRDAATVKFDNSTANTTSGLGADGTANQTLTWNDVIDMAAVLMAENHVPTDFIAHPLMWALFLKDQHFNFGGTNAASSWGMRPGGADGDAAARSALNSTAPMGLNVLVSPYVNFTAGTPAKSDVFLIDRNEVGVLLVKDELSTDEFSDPTRDLRSLKMKERYDIVTLGDGEGIVVAKDVALARNYELVLHRNVA